MHAVISKMIRTINLDTSDICTSGMIDKLLTNNGLVIQSTHHTVLGTNPGGFIFGIDMLFNIPFLYYWS